MLCYEKIFCDLDKYTGCPRRKRPNFGRVFLRSKYTDITQNNYIHSSMVTEILAREKCRCLFVCVLYSVRDVILVVCTCLQRANPAVAVRCDRQSVDFVSGANIRFVFVIARQ